MLPEAPLGNREELVMRKTLIFLWDLYAARWRAAAGALALIRAGEATPASLQTHGQSPLPPTRGNTTADGASGGSSRRVEGRLGCYILEAFTGTCHRSPVAGDGRGLVLMGWFQWVQKGQSELLGVQRLAEAGSGGLRMGQ